MEKYPTLFSYNPVLGSLDHSIFIKGIPITFSTSDLVYKFMKIQNLKTAIRQIIIYRDYNRRVDRLFRIAFLYFKDRKMTKQYKDIFKKNEWLSDLQTDYEHIEYISEGQVSVKYLKFF